MYFYLGCDFVPRTENLEQKYQTNFTFFRWVRCSRPAVHDFVPLNRTQVRFFCSTEQKFPNRKLCSLYFCPDSEQGTEIFKDKNRANRHCKKMRTSGAGAHLSACSSDREPVQKGGTRTMYFQRASMPDDAINRKLREPQLHRVAYILVHTY